jgi:hypothetical protein
MNLILTLFTAFTTVLYIGGLLAGNFLVGNARARIVTDKETEISTVSCLAVLQYC